MKSRIQVRKKLSSLRRLLDHAEDNYHESVGLRDEGSWYKRCKQLEAQIEMLIWVLEDPVVKSEDPVVEPEDPVITEYGAYCNPKRHGE